MGVFGANMGTHDTAEHRWIHVGQRLEPYNVENDTVMMASMAPTREGVHEDDLRVVGQVGVCLRPMMTGYVRADASPASHGQGTESQVDELSKIFSVWRNRKTTRNLLLTAGKNNGN